MHRTRTRHQRSREILSADKILSIWRTAELGIDAEFFGASPTPTSYDTGVFDDNRYWVVTVDYVKAG
jgi:hypothetical protein